MPSTTTTTTPSSSAQGPIDGISKLNQYLDNLALALQDYLPLTGSVDIRHFEETEAPSTTSTRDTCHTATPNVSLEEGTQSSHRRSRRLAIVDTNRFPAGFNHVDTSDYETAAEILRTSSSCSRIAVARHIVIVHEAHTRMLAYYESVECLGRILERAWPEKCVSHVRICDLEERFGGMDAGRMADTFFLLNADLSTGSDLWRGGDLSIGVDLAGGITEEEEGDHEGQEDAGGESGQAGIVTHPERESVLMKHVPSIDRLMGWNTRSKAVHFAFLSPILEHAASILGLRPYALQARFGVSAECCVEKPQDRERLAVQIDDMVGGGRTNDVCPTGSYRQKVFVKNDSGTYGLGLYAFSSGDELRVANSTVLDKLSYARCGQRARRYLLQEGVPTSLEDADGRPMEVVLVCLAGKVCSYFVRVGLAPPPPTTTQEPNHKRNSAAAMKEPSNSSLNVHGSTFVTRTEFESNPKFAAASRIVRRSWACYECLGRMAMIAMAREALWYSLNRDVTVGQDAVAALAPSLSVGIDTRSKVFMGGTSIRHVDGSSEEFAKNGGKATKKKSKQNSTLADDDQELRKLVGIIMNRVSCGLLGLTGARIARQRLAIDLNTMRKNCLRDIREGVGCIEESRAKMLSIESDFCQGMGIDVDNVSQVVPEGSSVDENDASGKKNIRASTPISCTPKASASTSGENGCNITAANVNKGAAPFINKTPSCSTNSKTNGMLKGKNVDDWLRVQVAAQIQNVDTKEEKSILAKRLQNIKKELQKRIYSGEDELRLQFETKLCNPVCSV